MAELRKRAGDLGCMMLSPKCRRGRKIREFARPLRHMPVLAHLLGLDRCGPVGHRRSDQLRYRLPAPAVIRLSASKIPALAETVPVVRGCEGCSPAKR